MMRDAYVSAYLDNGAIVKWDYISLPHHLDISYSEDGNTRTPIALGVSPFVTQFAVDKTLTSGITEFYLHIEEKDVNNNTVNEATVLVNISNSSGRTVMPVAMDESGNAKYLRTDRHGNLLVTALALDSIGSGDASASNQLSQLSAINATKASIDGVKSSVDANTAKLNDVRINASQVSDLKTVTVQNFPTNYPDSQSKSVLDAINSKVATEASSVEISSKLSNLIKKSDLSITAGIQDINVVNFPTDYPSVDVSSKLSNIETYSSTIADNTGDSYSTLLDIGSVLSSSEAKITSIIGLITSYLNTYPDADSNALLDIKLLLTDLLTKSLSASDIDRVISSITPLLKTSDLPIVNSSLTTSVSNFPNDYADSQAHSILSDIKTQLQNIDTNAVTISSSIPSGSNMIGSVSVDSSVLPTGASTESTLVSVYNMLAALKAEVSASSSGSLKNRIDLLLSKLDSIYNQISEASSTSTLYSNTSSIEASATISTGILNNFTNSTVIIGAACDPLSGFKLSVYTSDDGVIYFPIKGYVRVALEGGIYHIIKVPTTMKYIRVDITNSSNITIVDAMYLTVKKE